LIFNFEIKENESYEHFIKRLNKYLKKYHHHTFVSIKEKDKYNENTMPKFELKKNIGIIKFYSFTSSSNGRNNDKDYKKIVKLVNDKLTEWFEIKIKTLIIDFRKHQGGSFYPIAEIFGKYFPTLFGFYSNNDITWLSFNEKLLFNTSLSNKNLFPIPIKVIIGKKTASSGEFSSAIFYGKKMLFFMENQLEVKLLLIKIIKLLMI
jgi:C-terminal processing protease CtpA/Prc